MLSGIGLSISAMQKQENITPNISSKFFIGTITNNTNQNLIIQEEEPTRIIAQIGAHNKVNVSQKLALIDLGNQY